MLSSAPLGLQLMLLNKLVLNICVISSVDWVSLQITDVSMKSASKYMCRVIREDILVATLWRHQEPLQRSLFSGMFRSDLGVRGNSTALCTFTPKEACRARLKKIQMGTQETDPIGQGTRNNHEDEKRLWRPSGLSRLFEDVAKEKE